MSTPAPARLRRAVTRALCLALLVLLGTVSAVGWRLSAYADGVQRIPDALPATADRPVDDPGETWLLMGSDLRGKSTSAKWRPEEARSDVIMLLHVPKHERRAYVISIPRDSWVRIPGHGKDKINEAFAIGGPRLLVRTVQDLTRSRIDHFAATDFHGFRDMTDALGGVDVHLKDDVRDPSNGWSWSAGRNHLDGEGALRFVRERKGLPKSDFDRVKRQQAFLRAMGAKATDTGVASNPAKLDRFLATASDSLAVDATAGTGTLRGLARRLHAAGPERMAFVSLPAASTDWVGKKNVVRLDENAIDGLFTAMREDRLDGHVARHDLENNVDTVR